MRPSSLPPSLPPSLLLPSLPSFLPLSLPTILPSLPPSLRQARITCFDSRLLLFEANNNESTKEGGKKGGRESMQFNRSENRAMATHGFDFLKERMWDKENGGFVWRVAADG